MRIICLLDNFNNQMYYIFLIIFVSFIKKKLHVVNFFEAFVYSSVKLHIYVFVLNC